TIREYGLEGLAASGEAEALGRGHAAYYLARAEAAEPKLRTAERSVWLERLEQEHDNLRAALAWAQATPGGGETALRLAGRLAWFWWARGHLSEGRRWLEAALTRAGAPERTPSRARALRGAGLLAWAQGDNTVACRRNAEGVAIGRELGD